MRKFITPAVAAAAFLFVASPSESAAQVYVQNITPTYGYSPYYGGYGQPFNRPYYGGTSQRFNSSSYGSSGVVLSPSGLNLGSGWTTNYGSYNRGYSNYYGSSNRGFGSYYGGSLTGWSGGNRNYYSTRGFRR